MPDTLGQNYAVLVGELLGAIACARDFATAQRVIEQGLDVVMDARFLPAMAEHFRGPRDEPINQMAMMMAQMALISTLTQMPPERLGAPGLAVILALGDQKLIEFAERYGEWLDGAFFSHLETLIASLNRFSANDLADFILPRFQNANEGLRVRRAMDLMKPLIEGLFSAEPQAFMELAVRQGRHAEAWARDGLTTVFTDFFDKRTFGDFGVAFCAWSLLQATEILSELASEEDVALADALRYQAMMQVAGWTDQFVRVNQLDAVQALARFTVWLAWGNHPPKPHPTLQKLARVRSESDLRKLVEEEPWLLSQPAIDSIRDGGAFVVIPDLFGSRDLLPRIAGWLKRWQTDLIRADKNPIVQLARQVESRQVNPEQAQSKIRALKVDILQLAAIDEHIQNTLHVASEYETVLADLNYQAAAKSGNLLMQGYAALSRGFIRQEQAPRSEIKPHLEEAIQIARQLNHPLLLAHALDAMGQVYAALGEIDHAIDCFRESQSATRRLPPGYGRSETLLHLAALHLEKDNLEMGERYLRLVAQYRTPEEVSENAGRYWFLWGGLLWQKGDREGTREAWARAERIGLQLGNLGIRQEVQYHRAMMALEQGNSDLAEELLAQVNAITPASEQFRLLQGLAMLDWRQGKYQQFIAHAKQAVAEAQRMGNLAQELAIRIRLMMVYEDLRWQEEAQAEEARCAKLAQELGDNTMDVNLLLSRGLSLARQGKPRAALVSYRAALRKAHQHKEVRFVSTLLQNIGASYLDLGKLDLADLMLGIARAVEGRNITPLTGVGIELNQASVWARKAQKLMHEGQDVQARALFRKAEEVWRTAAERTDLTLAHRLSALNSLGSLYADLGDAAQRAWAFQSAVELLDQQRVEFSSPVIQKRFLRDRAGFYSTAIEATVLAGQVIQAVEIAEKMRARALGSRLLQLTAVPEKLRDDYRRLLANFEQAQDRWLGQEITQGDWMSQRWAIAQSGMLDAGGDLQCLQREAEKSRRELDDLTQRIREENPSFTLLPMSTPLKYADIQSALANQPATAFVYFQTRPTGTLVCIVNSKQCESLVLPLTLEHLVHGILPIVRMSAPRAEGFLSRFKAIEGWFSSTSFASTVDFVANRLAEWLWADLHPRLQALGVRDLVLLPDAFLALLPLHIAPLVARDRSATAQPSTDWLLDHYTISYAPSVQVWDLCRRRAKMRAGLEWSALLAGANGNVPLSAAISGILTDILGDGNIIWTKKDALLDTNLCSILHIHAHGRFDADLPEGTALQLSEQDKLTLAEVSRSFSLEQTRLVVLSACESGEVAMEPVPEFVGLPSAFLLSGAAAVVAAPWRVDETATVLLLARFYQQIVKGVGIAESLNRVQCWLRDLRLHQIVRELENLCSIVSASVGTAPVGESARARMTLRGAVERMQEQDRMLARLVEQVDGVDRETASQILLAEIRAHPAESDPLEKALHDTVDNLWMEMQSSEWETPRLLATLHDLRERPFGSPFYWGSFQIVGASD